MPHLNLKGIDFWIFIIIYISKTEMNTSPLRVLAVVYLIFLILVSSVYTQNSVTSKVALVVDSPYYGS